MVEGTERLLQQGDLALVPHGKGHVVASAAGLCASNLFEIAREQLSERYETLRLGGEGERAAMICGLFKFDDPAAQQLLDIVAESHCGGRLEFSAIGMDPSTLRMISVEARAMGAVGKRSSHDWRTFWSFMQSAPGSSKIHPRGPGGSGPCMTQRSGALFPGSTGSQARRGPLHRSRAKRRCRGRRSRHASRNW